METLSGITCFRCLVADLGAVDPSDAAFASKPLPFAAGLGDPVRTGWTGGSAYGEPGGLDSGQAAVSSTAFNEVSSPVCRYEERNWKRPVKVKHRQKGLCYKQAPAADLLPLVVIILTSG